MRRVIAALGAILTACPILAAPACRMPETLPTPHPEQASASQPARTLPIGGYTLALIWLPETCRTQRAAADRDGPRCGSATRGGFVLHGLWPDGEGQAWPQYCADAPILPQSVLKAGYCATPSAQLLQHEWAKHGTCMPGYSPARYFAEADRLFAGVRAPDMDRLSRRRLTTTGFARAFAAANRGMDADMVRPNLDKAGWLQEVWLCLDRDFRRRRCPAVQAGARTATTVRIWRERR